MYANPTDKRHETLEDTKCACNLNALFLAHARLGESVCKGHGEGVSRKAYTKKDAVKEEYM